MTLHRITIALHLAVLLSCTGYEMAGRDSVQYYYEPRPLIPSTSVFQIGGSATLLPEPVVENEYPVPAIDVQYKLGLAGEWSLVTSGSTNFFSNLIHGGLQWNRAWDRFSLGIAQHVGGFMGFISAEGQFDNSWAWAGIGVTLVRAGFRLDDYALSVTGAASYIIHSESNVADVNAQGPNGTWNDLYLTLAVEQPFLKESFIALGFSLTYSRTPYQTWLLFNTYDQRLFVPEFFCAVQL